MALVGYDLTDAQLIQWRRQLECDRLEYEEAKLRHDVAVLEYERDQFYMRTQAHLQRTQPNMHQLCHAVDIASADSDSVELAGKRVGVFWKDMKRWYEGVVVDTRQITKALIKYDDGEEHWEEEWTNAADIERCAHCPKLKGHTGRCLGGKRAIHRDTDCPPNAEKRAERAIHRDTDCPPNVEKRARVPTAKLGVNDGWSEEINRRWRTRALRETLH
jgi:hypothetical protein